MKHLHLLWEVLLQPLVLLDDVLDELYRHFSVDFDGSFAFLATVEPRLRPPHYSVLVGIDADSALYVKALDINVKVGKRIDDALAYCCAFRNFFFTSSLVLARKTPCISAR